MNFLELSLSEREREGKIYVNPRHITSFNEYVKDGRQVTVLCMNNDHEYWVKESAEFILELIPYGEL